MSDFKENIEKLNVRQIVLSSVMTAFGLVVALVWKDTIIATVDYLLPNTDDGTLQGMYISAIAVTALVMVLAKFAITLNERVEKEIDRVQSYFDDDEDENKED
jgi:hypothetical protein|tara:strand:+ start:7719 stop:8027 length:309 start_codon:yes stop_codon:yes gene_type:complete